MQPRARVPRHGAERHARSQQDCAVRAVLADHIMRDKAWHSSRPSVRSQRLDRRAGRVVTFGGVRDRNDIKSSPNMNGPPEVLRLRRMEGDGLRIMFILAYGSAFCSLFSL